MPTLSEILSRMQRDGHGPDHINAVFKEAVGSSVVDLKKRYGNDWGVLTPSQARQTFETAGPPVEGKGSPHGLSTAEIRAAQAVLSQRDADIEEGNVKRALSRAERTKQELELQRRIDQEDQITRPPVSAKELATGKWAVVPKGKKLEDVETPKQKNAPILPENLLTRIPAQAAETLAAMGSTAVGAGHAGLEQGRNVPFKIEDPRLRGAAEGAWRGLSGMSLGVPGMIYDLVKDKEPSGSNPAVDKMVQVWNGLEEGKKDAWRRNFGELLSQNLKESREGLGHLVADVLALRPHDMPDADFAERLSQAVDRGYKMGKLLPPAVIGGSGAFIKNLLTDPAGTARRYPLDTVMFILPILAAAGKTNNARLARFVKAIESSEPMHLAGRAVDKVGLGGLGLKDVGRGVTTAMMLGDVTLGGMTFAPELAGILGTVGPKGLRAAWKHMHPGLKKALTDKWHEGRQQLSDKAHAADPAHTEMQRDVIRSADDAEATIKLGGDQFAAHAAAGDAPVTHGTVMPPPGTVNPAPAGAAMRSTAHQANMAGHLDSIDAHVAKQRNVEGLAESAQKAEMAGHLDSIDDHVAKQRNVEAMGDTAHRANMAGRIDKIIADAQHEIVTEAMSKTARKAEAVGVVERVLDEVRHEITSKAMGDTAHKADMAGRIDKIIADAQHEILTEAMGKTAKKAEAVGVVERVLDEVRHEITSKAMGGTAKKAEAVGVREAKTRKPVQPRLENESRFRRHKSRVVGDKGEKARLAKEADVLEGAAKDAGALEGGAVRRKKKALRYSAKQANEQAKAGARLKRSLEKSTVKSLKAELKSRGERGYSKLRRKALIDRVVKARLAAGDVPKPAPKAASKPAPKPAPKPTGKAAPVTSVIEVLDDSTLARAEAHFARQQSAARTAKGAELNAIRDARNKQAAGLRSYKDNKARAPKKKVAEVADPATKRREVAEAKYEERLSGWQAAGLSVGRLRALAKQRKVKHGPKLSKEQMERLLARQGQEAPSASKTPKDAPKERKADRTNAMTQRKAAEEKAAIQKANERSLDYLRASGELDVLKRQRADRAKKLLAEKTRDPDVPLDKKAPGQKQVGRSKRHRKGRNDFLNTARREAEAQAHREFRRQIEFAEEKVAAIRDGRKMTRRPEIDAELRAAQREGRAPDRDKIGLESSAREPSLDIIKVESELSDLQASELSAVWRREAKQTASPGRKKALLAAARKQDALRKAWVTSNEPAAKPAKKAAAKKPAPAKVPKSMFKEDAAKPAGKKKVSLADEFEVASEKDATTARQQAASLERRAKKTTVGAAERRKLLKDAKKLRDKADDYEEAMSKLEEIGKKVMEDSDIDPDVSLGGFRIPFAPKQKPYSTHVPRRTPVPHKPETYRRKPGKLEYWELGPDGTFGRSFDKNKKALRSDDARPAADVIAESEHGAAIVRIAENIANEFNRHLPARAPRLSPKQVQARYVDVIGLGESSMAGRRAQGGFTRWLSKRLGLAHTHRQMDKIGKVIFNELGEHLGRIASNAFEAGEAQSAIIVDRAGNKLQLRDLLQEYAAELGKTAKGRQTLAGYKDDALRIFFHAFGRKAVNAVPFFRAQKILESYLPEWVRRSKAIPDMSSPGQWHEALLETMLDDPLRALPPFWPYLIGDKGLYEKLGSVDYRDQVAARFGVPRARVDYVRDKIKKGDYGAGEQYATVRDEMGKAEQLLGMPAGALLTPMHGNMSMTPSYGRLLVNKRNMSVSYDWMTALGVFSKGNYTFRAPEAHVRNKVCNIITRSMTDGISPFEAAADIVSETKMWAKGRADKLVGLARDKYEALAGHRDMEGDLFSAIDRATPVSGFKGDLPFKDSMPVRGFLKYRSVMGELWKLGDSSSKIAMASKDFDAMVGFVRKLKEGEYVTVGSFDRAVKIVKTADGYKVPDGRVLKEGLDLYKVLANPAMERASRLYVNYNEVGTMFDALKKAPAISAVSPYVIYGWKSMSLSKQGMLRTMLAPNRGLLGATNSTAVLRMQRGMALRMAGQRLTMTAAYRGVGGTDQELRKAFSNGFTQNATSLLLSDHDDPLKVWTMPAYGVVPVEQAMTLVRTTFAVQALAARYTMAARLADVPESKEQDATHRRMQRLAARLAAGDIMRKADLPEMILFGQHLGHDMSRLVGKTFSSDEWEKRDAFKAMKLFLGGDTAAMAKSIDALLSEGGKAEVANGIVRAWTGFGWTAIERSKRKRAFLKAMQKGWREGLKKGGLTEAMQLQLSAEDAWHAARVSEAEKKEDER